ncbi:MAG TPA: lysine-2,3-aminomutase-like protein [Alphaproteobacteria bacterium]|jgi:lysine 2,3-aminomutase
MSHPSPSRPAAATPAKTLRDADALADAGLLGEAELPAARQVARRYAVAVTPALAEALRGRGSDDPLVRQFVPSADELVIAREELGDPIGDEAHRPESDGEPVKGIVHRYRDRVLLKPLHACAVYCRFCFRREQVGPGGDALDAAELEAALDYIRGHGEIWEVILSGGDPLLLSPRRLREIVAALAAIEHVGVIRIHTRLPVADPAKVGAEMVAALKGPKAVYVVLHCNHADELNADVKAACARLVDAGIPMLSQSVLLAGVNDDAPTMERLMRALVAARIKPYYLHHPDLARGTGHFRLPIERGQEILRSLRGSVSGLCQPTYVLDIPGGHGKVPIGPDYLRQAPDGSWTVADPDGGAHAYPPKCPENDGESGG